MKKFPVIAVLCFSIVCALGLELYRAHKEKKRNSAEWKQISDSIDTTTQETIRTLEEMPKIGK